MSTYNYKCLSCDEVFVVFERMSEKPISNCKFCSSNNIKKMISGGSGLIFKGSGFYLTDYKQEKKKNSNNKNIKK